MTKKDEKINPADYQEVCHCGHILDEHEGSADPCTIEGCDCIAYEESVPE